MDDDFNDPNAQLAKIHSQDMWNNGASFDDILDYLRSLGFSQGISVFILQRATSIFHFEAKKAVIDSEVWADHRQANENLQSALAVILDEDDNDKR